MISATSRMSSTVNDTLDHGAVSCVTAPSPSPEFRTPEPYILMLVRTRRTCHPESSIGLARDLGEPRVGLAPDLQLQPPGHGLSGLPTSWLTFCTAARISPRATRTLISPPG